MINEAREMLGYEPFKEFQKVAYEFGNPKPVQPKIVRCSFTCKNCGANQYYVNGLIENATDGIRIKKYYYICAFCGTTYEKGAT